MSKKRVKIWFDDEGEPHETLVDEEPESSPTATDARRTRIWFDDEGEPHEAPVDEPAGAFDGKTQQVFFDDEGLPHNSPQAAAAANARVRAERTQVSAPPQTHSSFTQGLTPKPMYFERVETQREGSLAPRQSVQARSPEAARPAMTPATPGSPSGTTARPMQARPGHASQTVPAQQPAARTMQPAPGSGAAQPGPRTTAPAARSPTPQQPPRDVAPRPQPGATTREPARTASPPRETLGRPAAREASPPATEPDVERTVISPAATAQPRIGASTSLATNYRAAVAHAAMVESNRTDRIETRDRRVPTRAPLIGVDDGPDPFAEGVHDRTVATATPQPSQLASTASPASGRASVAGQAPMVSRPTLTHAPVPMDDRAHQAPTARPTGGGFFNRGAQAPTAPTAPTRPADPPAAAARNAHAAETRVVPQARAGLPAAPVPSRVPETPKAPPAGRPDPDPAARQPAAFFSQPVPEPAAAQPQARRITDPRGTPASFTSPAPQKPAEPPAGRNTVHEQATVVRDSPFLQSEATVVRSPAAEEEELAPMRRRLTEPMLARGPGFIAPANQGIQTERASLWRLAVAGWIDACAAIFVGVGTAAAEMLMFGGHWPSEATNPLDALALWMHNYPGTRRRAVLVMLLFAWCYAALGARTGRTPGRMLTRLIAVQQDGAMMTWSRAALRSFIDLFSALFFGAGYFWAIVDSQHRAVHDIFSHSIVVKRKAT